MPENFKRAFSSTDDNDGEEANSTGSEIYVSSPIHDRASTFVAHFHPLPAVQAATSTPKPLTAIVKTLQAHPSFAGADHRIVAWRRRSTQRKLGTNPTAASSNTSEHAIYVTGSDDDGEKYAGKRLERLLGELDVHGAVVVARWYGGVLLGPVRFKHIEDVAREAVAKCKAQADWSTRQVAPSGEEGLRKRARVETIGDEAASEVASAQGETQRVRLAKQLVDRDASIAVLRGLLAAKSSTSTTQSTATSPGSQPSPVSRIDYLSMPLPRLRQLEKARDATIRFILQRIDQAEADQVTDQTAENDRGDLAQPEVVPKEGGGTVEKD